MELCVAGLGERGDGSKLRVSIWANVGEVGKQRASRPGARSRVCKCWVWEARLGTLAGNYDL